MSIAITDDHRALAETAAALLTRRNVRAESRALLDGASDDLPTVWPEFAELGWLGLHLPEAYGGSGFGLPELAVLIEEMGRAIAPGPFVPTVIASAVIASAMGATAEGNAIAERHLPGLADGSTVGAVALQGQVALRASDQAGAPTATGDAGVVISANLADIVIVAVGDDAVVLDLHDPGVRIDTAANLDPTRPAARVILEDVPAIVLTGAAATLRDTARTLFAAEATGIARECTHQAVEYAKVRHQFGRPIATFQAVKHHCANMAVAAELATAAVWDAARAATSGDEQFAVAAAAASALAMPAADLCANLNIQVHGGIGFTWEHDAHLYLRRAAVLGALLEASRAAADLTDLTRQGIQRHRNVDLPPEAEPLREAVRTFATETVALEGTTRRQALLDSGYAVPHWPRPFGRAAGAVEQLVIEQEFAAAGLSRPSYGITGWVILTLVQQATAEQIARWVRPALSQEVVWCQLFSEPDAGSDAAGVTTRATRVDGGWLVNGQKVWTSGAHLAGFGLATVRTDPDAAKHDGITTMVIDMHAEGVEVRPLRMPTGNSEFNEVFFDDVFVPDDDVVGPVNGGWRVARATLGNESVSIGGGDGAMSMPASMIVAALDASPDRLDGGAARVGRYAATHQAMTLLNVRAANRAVAGGDPGPEGAITKLVLSELGHDAAAMLHELAGPNGAFLDGGAAVSGMLVLMHRALSIAGGTSEIKRNQIGERILGLPRDPLIN